MQSKLDAGILICPACGGSLVSDREDLSCTTCGQRYRIVDGILDLFAGQDDPVGPDPNRAWLDPQVVAARDTVYRLRARSLEGMVFCMRAIAERTPPGGRILEVGMGTGHFTRWLAEVVPPSARIFAFDFSWPIIDIARANTSGLENVTLLRANARGPLPFLPAWFDVVFLRLAPLGAASVPNVQAGFDLLKAGGWYFEAGWEKTPYETPPTQWALQHGFTRAEHHVWEYRRAQSDEERRAWEMERGALLAQGGKIRGSVEGEYYEDGRRWVTTVENLLVAQKPGRG